MSGINFVVFFIIAYAIYGYQPQVGVSLAIDAGGGEGHKVSIAKNASNTTAATQLLRLGNQTYAYRRWQRMRSIS